MLHHTSNCAIIVSENDTNDKKPIIECILYHLHNYRSLHSFWDSLEVLWSLMLFWFFYSFFRSITLTTGLEIEDHSNDPLTSTTNDEGMPARGVISTTGWFLLPAHIICNGKFNLVLIFSLSNRADQSTYDWLLCYSVYFFNMKNLLNFQISHQSFFHACICFNFCKCPPPRIPAKLDSALPRSLLTLPPPPLLWDAYQIPIGSWYYTIWILHSGGHHNDVYFSGEDE